MREKRKSKNAILLAVEGYDDQKFSQYIRDLYKCNGAAIAIRSVNGGSPLVGIDYIVRMGDHKDYDKKYFLCDTDRDWNDELFQKAKKENIKLIGFPDVCLEGLLLKLLEKPIPKTAKACKTKIKTLIGSKKSGLRDLNLETYWPKARLDKFRLRIPCLNDLINIFEE